jgi:pimeloyl-ACP methyl ester carboxylesterase
MGESPSVQPLIEHRLELAGYATRVLELEGKGAPIVLLHGFGDSADTWRLTLDRLARRDRRALALDLPGFGAASRLLRDAPVLPQLDAFAAAVVQHVAAEHGAKVVVAGNSLGGAVALRLGERSASLPLAGIVPVAPAGLDMPRWFGAIERDRVVGALLSAPVPVPQRVVRSMVGQAYRRLAFARPRDIATGVVGSFAGHHPDRRAVRRLMATGRRLLPELADVPFSLQDVRCPVLLVWGDEDRMVTHRGARHIVEALPDTTYVLLEGCGHCPQLEEPDRFVELLLDFARAPRAKVA